MAQGLQYLRTKGVLHNDIKPANILFNGKKAVLIDFGLAMFDRFGTLSSGGTPWYIPPEYLRTKERKAPADIWALGVVGLYLRRQIRLPDTGLDVPSWLIRDIGPLPSAAKNQMEQWLNFVRSEASKSARASDLGGLVAQMLGIRSAERPTPDELVKSLESLVIASEVD
jgi:serine/threonine protein kinase